MNLDDLKTLVTSGYYDSEIADMLGYATSTVRRARLHLGLASGKHYLHMARMREIPEAYTAGSTVAEISEEMGCSRQFVYSALRAAGIPLARDMGLGLPTLRMKELRHDELRECIVCHHSAPVAVWVPLERYMELIGQTDTSNDQSD